MENEIIIKPIDGINELNNLFLPLRPVFNSKYAKSDPKINSQPLVGNA